MVGLVGKNPALHHAGSPACRWPPPLRSYRAVPQLLGCNLRQQLSERPVPFVARHDQQPPPSSNHRITRSLLEKHRGQATHQHPYGSACRHVRHHQGLAVRATRTSSRLTDAHTLIRVDPPPGKPGDRPRCVCHVGPLLGQTVRRSDGQTETGRKSWRESGRNTLLPIQLVSLMLYLFYWFKRNIQRFFSVTTRRGLGCAFHFWKNLRI